MAEMTDERIFRSDEVLYEIKNQKFKTKSWLKNLFILFISLLIFFRLGLLESRVNDVLVIIFVLLVHEIGHFTGMRLFGYRNIQMFLIPFFGAAVSGESQNVATYKKAIVSLLGPLPGLFIGVIFLTVYVKTKTPIYLQLTILFLIINGFNLLPFLPLDGGQFLYEVLLSRNRYIELCFRVLASLSLITVAYFLETWLLGLIALFNLASVRFPFKLASIASEVKHSVNLKRKAPKNFGSEKFPPEIAEQIINKVCKYFSARLNLKTVANYTSEIWNRVIIRPPGVIATIGLLSVYLLSFCLPFGSLVGVAVVSQFEHNPFTRRRIIEYQKPNGEAHLKQQIYGFGKLRSEIDVDPKRLVYHGRGVSYRQDGTISREGTWHEGKWHGEWKEYDRQENLIRVTIFDRGKFILRKEWSSGRWVEKSWEELPLWLKKAIINHNESPPLGPKGAKKNSGDN